MKSIKDWLGSAQLYAVGVALYKAHGDNELLKKALDQGESPYRKKRLVDALREISHKMPAPKPTVITMKKEEPKHQPIVIGASLPENKTAPDKDPYREEWLPLYKEMANLQARLEDMPLEERGVAAHRILWLERKCLHIWGKRAYWEKYGEHMKDDEADSDSITDPNVLQKKLTNARSYKSKVLKQLEKNKDNPKLLEKLQRHQEQIDELEKRLAHE